VTLKETEFREIGLSKSELGVGAFYLGKVSDCHSNYSKSSKYLTGLKGNYLQWKVICRESGAKGNWN